PATIALRWRFIVRHGHNPSQRKTRQGSGCSGGAAPGQKPLIERVADALTERGRLSGTEGGALIGGGSNPAPAAGSSALDPHGEPETAPRPGRGVRGEGPDGS